MNGIATFSDMDSKRNFQIDAIEPSYYTPRRRSEFMPRTTQADEGRCGRWLEGVPIEERSDAASAGEHTLLPVG